MKAEDVLEMLLQHGGSDLSDRARRLLDRSVDELGEQDLQDVQGLAEPAVTGFFRAAVQGAEFVPSSRIKERFGKTLAENYPEAGPSFLRVATTYWTLKLVLSDEWAARETVRYQLLSTVESNVGALFFPTPGPIKIDPAQRAADQRAFLEGVVPEMDIDDFIANNPILQRDRKSKASGCLTGLVALAVPSVFLRALGSVRTIAAEWERSGSASQGGPRRS